MKVIGCIFYSHNIWMVIIAALFCFAGSTITIKSMNKAKKAQSYGRHGWFFLTAVSGGSSIWATHFIAMLGYEVDAPYYFDLVLTVLSVLIAIVGIYLSTWITIGMKHPFAPIAGGFAIGLTISAMHYTGMMAYHVDGLVSWDRTYVLISVLLAIVLAALSMQIAARPTNRSILAKSILALVLSIVSLHFTGMTAFQVTPMPGIDPSLNDSSLIVVGGLVSVLCLLVMGVGIASYSIDNDRISDSNKKIAEVSNTDRLTGLPNRSAFDLELSKYIKTGKPFYILGISLKKFREINDYRGHFFGDNVLIFLANHLRELAGKRAHITRVGGDEFCLLVPSPDHEHTFALVDEIKASLDTKLKIGETNLTINCALGVASYPQNGRDYRSLVRNTHLAIEAAKMNAITNIVHYNDKLGEKIRRQRKLVRDLEVALKVKSLNLFYQPQIDLKSGQIIGYEALARWNHPTLGSIRPDEFIMLAEQSGLIHELGKWAIFQACSDVTHLPDGSCIAVNISAIQLLDKSLPHIIREALVQNKLAAERLELEITETALIQENNTAMELMHKIKSLGVKIALDDFGTGYASFEVLKTFPFDKIKLDRSFVGDMTSSYESRAIVDASIQLAKNLNISILVEGVEDQAQLNELRKMGSDEAQGYYIGRPASLADLSSDHLTTQEKLEKTAS